MPIYEYLCRKCKLRFEEYHSASERDRLGETKCPQCRGTAPRYYGSNTFASPGSLDNRFSEDAPEYREMHYYEKKKDWARAAKAAEGVNEFARNKFLEKAKQHES